MKEMEELRDDIKMHLDLDRESQVNVKYWEVHVFTHPPEYCSSYNHRECDFYSNDTHHITAE